MTDAEQLLELFGTRNLKELAENFGTDIRKRDANVDAVIAKYMPALWLGQSLGTVAVRYSTFRGTLKDTRNKNAKEALSKLVFPTEATFLLNDIANKKGKENRLSEEVDHGEVIDLIKNLENMIENNDFPVPASGRQSKEKIEIYHLAVYIGLTTGRRFTEILKTLEISKHGKNIQFDGLIKREDEDTQENVYLLGEYKTIKKALTRLRKLFDVSELTNDEVNKKHSFTFNRYMKQNILNSDKYTFHDLRRLYSDACFELYADKENFDRDDFSDFVLGHKVDYRTSDRYRKYRYTNKKEV